MSSTIGRETPISSNLPSTHGRNRNGTFKMAPPVRVFRVRVRATFVKVRGYKVAVTGEWGAGDDRTYWLLELEIFFPSIFERRT